MCQDRVKFKEQGPATLNKMPDRPPPPGQLVRLRPLPTNVASARAQPQPSAQSLRAAIRAATEGAFALGPATKAQILDVAEKSFASSLVMQVLHDIPNARYQSVNDLWHQLAHFHSLGSKGPNRLS